MRMAESRDEHGMQKLDALLGRASGVLNRFYMSFGISFVCAVAMCGSSVYAIYCLYDVLTRYMYDRERQARTAVAGDDVDNPYDDDEVFVDGTDAPQLGLDARRGVDAGVDDTSTDSAANTGTYSRADAGTVVYANSDTDSRLDAGAEDEGGGVRAA